jgi:hypothetical protein
MLLLIFGTPHKQKIKTIDEKIQKTNQKNIGRKYKRYISEKSILERQRNC